MCFQGFGGWGRFDPWWRVFAVMLGGERVLGTRSGLAHERGVVLLMKGNLMVFMKRKPDGVRSHDPHVGRSLGKRRPSPLIAALVAASLVTGGLAASTAYAGGGGGNAGGGGLTTDGSMYLAWTYKDNNDGGWGPSSNTDGTKAALADMGFSLYSNAEAWIQEATAEANTNCVARFNEAHPDQAGQANCRVVGVGAVGTPTKKFGYAAGADHSIWMRYWNDSIAPYTFANNGTEYRTYQEFEDQPGMSVDKIADEYAPDWVNGSSTGTIVVIALNQYEPKPEEPKDYDLSISTQASGTATKAGETGAVSDRITLSASGSDVTENVSGSATLHWRGVDGTVKQVSKSFTASNRGAATVSVRPSDVVSSWQSWPAGKFWFDVSVPKQGKMKAAASHAGEHDPKESWQTSNVPPRKTIVNAAGDEISAPNDQIASGSLYTARISAHSSGSEHFWLYDIVDVSSQQVVLGAADRDDFSKIHVEDAAGNTVQAEISVDDAQAGKRVVKAHVVNPTSGVYTLVVPQAAKPSDGDYSIPDDSKACWQGDGQDCQTGDSREVGKVTPSPDKVWVLGKDGALTAEDPTWTNSVAADKKTFVAGDAIGAVVNGRIPAHLLNPLVSYSITDDWSGSARWIDWSDKSKVSVFVDGQDVTDQFTITIDAVNHTTTATAKAAFLAKTALKNTDSKVKLYVGGVIKAVDQADTNVTLTNKGSETWNNETKPTNEPPVYLRTPDPNKVWSKDESDAKNADDPDKSNSVSADKKTFVQADTVSVTVNGTLPKNLAKDLDSYELGDDWSKDAAKVDLSDTSSVRVYIDGVDKTSLFDVHSEGTKTWVSAKAGLLKGSANQTVDRKVRMTINGRLRANAIEAGQTVTVVNDGWEKWNQQSIPTNEPPIYEWAPNPDKSWIRYVDGKWQTVIDPDGSNTTGADDMKFLDGDLVGAVVNGTLPANLAKLSKIELTDDYADADYLFDLTGDVSKIRVYESDATTDAKSSVADIANKGRDVTDKFTITVKGTVVTATAKADYVAAQVGLKSAKQVTLLVPGRVNFANGKGVAQVRADFKKAAGSELTFCTDPTTGKELVNKGSQRVNDTTEATNEPRICGYIPPVEKKVIAEGSEGGDNADANGTTVFPGQKVEYRLTTKPQLPAQLAYEITDVAITDTYDEHLIPDMQTVEAVDLNTGDVISKHEYTTAWDEQAHSFTLTFDKAWVKANWPAGSNPRIQIRFEGTVSKDAPTNVKVGNEWKLTLNNMITPSNRVENQPPSIQPGKQDTQKDPSINIDGKTALLGDVIYYRVNIDATKLTNTAYKVWRLGVVDDYDDEYLKLDERNVQVLDDQGKDVTARFNVQDKDGVVYAFAKTVDTYIDTTGKTVKGDPQPEDLQAYAALTDADHDPLTQPAIDQTLLGHSYQLVLPMSVIKVTDGYTVSNTATQVTNDQRDVTNTVTNPLKPVNPSKDVTVTVGGSSVNGHSIYKDHLFLYQLDSSILPPDRAYQQITDWTGVDQLDTKHDEYTGQWAVYATRDVYKDGQVVTAAGTRIAGSDYTGDLGDLFTLDASDTGLITVKATQTYLDLVSADNDHEQGWRLYLQVKRTSVADKVENTWTETVNGQPRESNTVWTKTPDMTPSLKLEKWDTTSGFEQGDRDDSKQALNMDKDSTSITFTITNTSKTDPDTGDGFWFKASDLDLTDTTIVGDAKVDMSSLVYPDNWDTLILKPGESVNITGTLKGVKEGDKHTNRAVVTGTPLTECQPDTTKDPFSSDGEDMDPEYSTGDIIETDGVKLCPDTIVTSNTDDWNGYRTKPLPVTGTAIMPLTGGMLLILMAGGMLILIRRRHDRPVHMGRHAQAAM